MIALFSILENAPPPGLTRGATNSFHMFVDGRVKPGQGGEWLRKA